MNNTVFNGSSILSNSLASGSYISANTSPTTMTLKNGDAHFEGDVIIKGVSIAETMEQINKRLAILIPDPEKLAKYEALKIAYDEYKLIEALLHEP
jgi:hypothetical protein